MSDRTWNAVDAKLYEEEWSPAAKLIAGVLIARCPNSYGVFDMPYWFLQTMFQGIFTRSEMASAMVEWEGSNGELGFVKFYRDRKVVWIVKKWKRAGRPSEKHWKGALNHLEDFPEVREDFLSYYKAHFKGIDTPLNGDTDPIDTPYKDHSNPDSESESESESDTEKRKKKIPSAKSADAPKSQNARRLITDTYQTLYMERFDGKKPPWGKKEGKRVTELLNDFGGDADRIVSAIRKAFTSDEPFMEKAVGSFMTLTASAVISQADTLGEGKLPFNKRISDDSRFTETREIEL